MQNAYPVQSRPSAAPQSIRDENPQVVDVDRILSAMKRQWRLPVASACASALLGLAYLFAAIPAYTSTAGILVEQNFNQIIDELSAGGGFLDDEMTLISQMELLKSQQIANRVIDSEKLLDDPDFITQSQTSLLGRAVGQMFGALSAWLPGETEATPDDAARRGAILQVLSDKLDVARLGRSYVLTVSYTSADPALSARIARAFGEAYLTDQLAAKDAETRRTSGWLQGRIDDLRRQSVDSDMAVQRFRQEHGLLTVDGKLVTDQRLSQLNSELTTAEADAATAAAKRDRVKAMIDSGDPNAVVADFLDSGIVALLQTKYLDAAKRVGELSERLDPDHQQIVRLRTAMTNYKNQMFDELVRLSRSYANDADVAQSKADQLRRDVAEATSRSQDVSEVQAHLRDLQRESESYRNLYQTFLQQYQESVQQQSFPVEQARVITEAKPADEPSSPRKGLVLGGAIVAGLLAGMGLGAFREFRDRFFRTADQIEKQLDLEYLGSVPLLSKRTLAPQNAGAKGLFPADPRETGGTRPEAAGSVAGYILDHPLSSVAETMRSAKVAADLALHDPHKIIGVLSILPDEGKSTVAASLAALFASHGGRTLLIDGDVRNPGLTRQLGVEAGAGILDAVTMEQPLENCLLTDPRTGLSLLPGHGSRQGAAIPDILSSRRTGLLLEEACRSYDYTIIDLPPLGAVSDVRAIAPRVDAFVLVVEWGRTARRVVQTKLDENPAIAEKVLGVVLNKVDEEKMALYRDFGGREYYRGRHSEYYVEAA